MFKEGLSEATKANLEILRNEEFLSSFYLAGGTACALHLGHRLSYDLDFFSTESFSENPIMARLKELGSLDIEDRSKDTLVGNFRGERVSFFVYPYPLLYELKNYKGVKIADLHDIACMKLDAISSRGVKRDFVDLYFIAHSGIGLDECLRLFQKKYKGIDYSLYHLLKSLSYFDDAEGDEMPIMVKRVSWEEVKGFFQGEAKRLGRGFLR